ncbi:MULTISPECIES: hypothetical protein [unclassified Egicoccus]|uniref:hypothetical protein n=1 Tax=unclassified Egicoccus TaxID=2635606 RepID=UPI00359D6306
MSAPKIRLAPLRTAAWTRAGDRCEAVFEHGNRCRNLADELHHRIKRAAGGNTLDRLAVDAIGDGTFEPARHLAHLVALCAVCHHEVAHGQPARARRLGLAVSGNVIFERWSGRTYYVGPSDEFRALWPAGGGAHDVA